MRPNYCRAAGLQPRTGKQLTVGTHRADARVLIKVSDSGNGIAAEDLEHIFEPFFSTKGFGVGLGLPLANGTVGQHGGEIEISSAKGQGTTVSVWLPIAHETDVSAA